MTLDELPPLREVIATHGLSARKSLGQNFLFDLNLTGRIARASGDLSQSTVIEVGPGPGALTRALLLAGAKKVVVLERDERFLPVLEQIKSCAPDRLEIHLCDAMATDLKSFQAPTGDTRLISNLPYNIATPLIVDLIKSEPWPSWWHSITVMVQKEVALRITAQEGEKAYGRLGLMCGWRAHCKRLFDVPAQAFVPPPKVTSSIIQLIPNGDPLPCPSRALETVSAAAFGQRRKMLRSSLRGCFDNAEETLNSLGIKPTARAEELGIADFVALANAKAHLPE